MTAGGLFSQYSNLATCWTTRQSVFDFHQGQDRLWGPSSLLSNGHRGNFSPVEGGEPGAWEPSEEMVLFLSLFPPNKNNCLSLVQGRVLLNFVPVISSGEISEYSVARRQR
jgi:hypothetical protein